MGGNTRAPIVAAIPQEFIIGCEQYAPVLQAGALSKINASRLAVAFKQCSQLQADETAWIVAYLNNLAGR